MIKIAFITPENYMIYEFPLLLLLDRLTRRGVNRQNQCLGRGYAHAEGPGSTVLEKKKCNFSKMLRDALL